MADERDLLPGEYTALGLLAHEAMHGYELARRWEASPLAEVLPAEQSVLYGYLRTLERRDLVEWEEVRVGNRPPRRIFSASEAGWEVLRPWLRAPVARLREVRADLLLKIYVLRLLDPASEARLLIRQVEACEAYLAQARAHLDAAEGFERLLWGSKTTAAEATIAWLRAAAPSVRGRRATA
ncbi:MAG: PadR family transcriptional regulator [Dehalococcoidia bacterium]|nr:PadR family transcriptional regulator [Dehalococcoidia bacterium]